MTIETRSVQNSAKPAGAADSRSARGKHGGADDSGAAGGFTAILASIEIPQQAAASSSSSSAAVDDSKDGATTDATAFVKPAGAGAAVKSSVQTKASGRAVSDKPVDPKAAQDPTLALETDKSAPLSQGDQAELAAILLLTANMNVQTELPSDTSVLLGQESTLLAQAISLPVANTLPVEVPKWGALPMTNVAATQAPQPATLVPQLATLPLTNASAPLPPQLATLPVVAGAAPAEPGSLTGSAASAITTAVPGRRPPIAVERAVAATGKESELPLESFGKISQTLRDSAAKAISAVAVPIALAPADTTGQADARGLPAVPKTTEQPLTPLATALAIASTATPSRREEQTKERSVFRSNVTEGSLVMQPLQLVTSSTQIQSVQDSSMPSDLYVAEKVAYWISNDVQKAELTLDGIGSKPVEVSIRMQGNEAHVAFRTDELQTRAALENASIHLKDLLQREGLVLSGVSVGTAGTGDSGKQERNDRGGVRHSVVGGVQPTGSERSPLSTRVGAGAVDLFV